jgi:hypothetical protein
LASSRNIDFRALPDRHAVQIGVRQRESSESADEYFDPIIISANFRWSRLHPDRRLV